MGAPLTDEPAENRLDAGQCNEHSPFAIAVAIVSAARPAFSKS